MDTQVISGIMVGAFGGAAAGLVVYVVQYLHNKIVFCRESNRIYEWLKESTTSAPGKGYRSTRSIASWNNVTEERARYLCSMHSKIYLSTGGQEDMWGIVLESHPRQDIEL